jgi:hypothetical protein
MFGGYMQAAAHAGLDGKGGMAGWYVPNVSLAFGHDF